MPPQALGVAGGLTAVARNLGMALGVGVGGAVFAAFSGGGGTGGLSENFVAGWRGAMVVALVVCLAALAVSRMRGGK